VIYHILEPPLQRSIWLRLTITGGSLAVAFCSRIWLEPWLRWHSPFALLLPAVLVSAWYGGAKAGLLATAIAGIGAVYAFMTPTGLMITNVSDAMAFLLFIAEGSLISGICEVLHHAVNRAQTSVAEAARKFELMADGAPVLIWSTDGGGRCVFVNRHWLDFAGRTAREEQGAAWPAHIHPDDLVNYQRTYQSAALQRRPYQLEYRLRRADGAYRWLFERAEPREDAESRFDGFIGSCTDITASRREREEMDFVACLQRNLGSSLDLDRLAGVLGDALVPALADWYCLELVRGENNLEVLGVAPSGPESPTLPFAIPAVSTRVLETGEAQFSPQADATALASGDEELRLRLTSLKLSSHLALPLLARGRIIGVLTLAMAGSGRTFGADELAFVRKIAGLAGFALDNASLYQRTLRALAGAEQARRQMAASERALDRQRALLQTIIDALPALVAYVGPEGKVLLANARYREWLGLVSGAPTEAIETAGARNGLHFAAHFRSAWSGETVVYEDVVGAGPSARQVAAILRPDRDPEGRVRGIVFHAYDITDRKNAYAELATARELLRCHADELEERVRQRTATLREMNTELEAFTYSVSHDLRTPVQFVRSFAEAITSDPQNSLSSDSATYLARIVSVTSRMESTIHDLLGYSRLARADMVLTPIALDDAVAEAVAHHQTTIQRSGARVVVDRELPRVRADRVGLFQILTNLLSNALKFSVPGQVPVIRISAENGSTFTRLRIADNGIGVPTRHHEKIFQLFERLHGAAEYPGTGIGLALVRKAATRMGGNCGVESPAEGGSRFWIDFPAAPVGPARLDSISGELRMRPQAGTPMANLVAADYDPRS